MHALPVTITRVPARVCASCWGGQLPTLFPPPPFILSSPLSPRCLERLLRQSRARGSQPRGLRGASEAKAGSSVICHKLLLPVPVIKSPYSQGPPGPTTAACLTVPGKPSSARSTGNNQ